MALQIYNHGDGTLALRDLADVGQRVDEGPSIVMNWMVYKAIFDVAEQVLGSRDFTDAIFARKNYEAPDWMYQDNPEAIRTRDLLTFVPRSGLLPEVKKIRGKLTKHAKNWTEERDVANFLYGRDLDDEDKQLNSDDAQSALGKARDPVKAYARYWAKMAQVKRAFFDMAKPENCDFDDSGKWYVIQLEKQLSDAMSLDHEQEKWAKRIKQWKQIPTSMMEDISDRIHDIKIDHINDMQARFPESLTAQNAAFT